MISNLYRLNELVYRKVSLFNNIKSTKNKKNIFNITFERPMVCLNLNYFYSIHKNHLKILHHHDHYRYIRI